MTLFRKAVSHSAYSALGTASVFLANFLFAGLTIRFLGNEQAGFFIVLASLFALSQIANGLGLATPATKRAAELYAQGDTNRVRQLAGSVLLVNVGIGVCVAGLCVVFFPTIFRWSKLPQTLEYEAFTTTVWLAISFVADQAGTSLRFLYSACLRQDLRNTTLAAMGLLGGVGRIVWLTFVPTMPTAAAATCAASVAWWLVDVACTRGLLGAMVRPSWCAAEVRPLLGFSLWELLNSVGIAAGNTVDRIILITYVGGGTLPYYAFAQRFFQQIQAALAQQFSFIFPLLAASGVVVQDKIMAVEDRARWFIATLGAVFYAAVILIGPSIAAVLVGPDFAENARWPILLASAQGFAVSLIIANYFLHYALGDGAANACFNLGNNVLVIVAALILIPRYDYLGASWAQLCVIPAAGVFLEVSRRILALKHSAAKYWSAYLSPTVLLVVTVAVGKGVGSIVSSGIGPAMLAASVGLAGGAIALLAVESLVFSSARRLSLLKSAWQVVAGRLLRTAEGRR